MWHLLCYKKYQNNLLNERATNCTILKERVCARLNLSWNTIKHVAFSESKFLRSLYLKLCQSLAQFIGAVKTWTDVYLYVGYIKHSTTILIIYQINMKGKKQIQGHQNPYSYSHIRIEDHHFRPLNFWTFLLFLLLFIVWTVFCMNC